MDICKQKEMGMKTAVMQTPIGYLQLEAENGAITRVDFTAQEREYVPRDPLLENAVWQLQEYFEGKRKGFDLPLNAEGTAFQKAAWQVLRQIPYGETITYGEEAERMGNKKAARAVGGANHRNPIAIIIPCHRVVAADGLGGYGSGAERKAWLLALEKAHT